MQGILNHIFTVIFHAFNTDFPHWIAFGSAGALQRLLQNGLHTAEAIDKADEATIKDLIYPVYFSESNWKKAVKFSLSELSYTLRAKP